MPTHLPAHPLVHGCLAFGGGCIGEAQLHGDERIDGRLLQRHDVLDARVVTEAAAGERGE